MSARTILDFFQSNPSPVEKLAEEKSTPQQEQVDQKLDHLLVVPHRGNDVGDPGLKGQNLLSSYEQKRLENIHRNRAVLEQLGLKSMHSNCAFPTRQNETAKKRKRAIERKIKMPCPETYSPCVRRRSSRLQKNSSPSSRTTTADDKICATKEFASQPLPEPEEILSYDDSSVLKYVCNAHEHANETSDSNKSIVHGTLKGYRMVPSWGTYVNKNLKQIYSMNSNSSLLAAGGHNGYVAIFGIAELQQGESIEALMAFKAHRGWIAAVSLALSQPNMNVLATASNDGSVKLWDINQMAESSNGSFMAKQLMEHDTLHQGGIFSMDIHHDKLLTSSKDNTIVLSTVSNADIKLNARMTYHNDIVKCAQFSPDGKRIASCGNDHSIMVGDARVGGASSILCIEYAHQKAINSVRWSPIDDNIIASAGFDAEMNLFDLRNPKRPLFVYRGHSLSLKNKIYHPVFVNQGRAIATCGSGSKELSLYSTVTGKTISRGALPFETVTIETLTNRLAVSHGASIDFLQVALH